MKKIAYADLSERINNNSGLVKWLNLLDKAITYATVLFYFIYLVYGIRLGLSTENGDYTLAYRSILIPGVAFVIVSLFRKIMSAPRPYEVYAFSPTIKKDTKGKSFPSRHVFSIFMVAMMYSQTTLMGCLVLCFLGVLLAILRVVGGVHFLRDVVAGAAIAIITGFLGFSILCGVFSMCMLVFS